MFNNKTLGSVLLISGNSIGAGMLGMPVLMGVMGFIPATITLLAVWCYMMFLAFLLLEANIWFKKEEVNLITLAEKLLGKVGKTIVWYSYIFLFSCLIMAYLVKAGAIIQNFLEYKFGLTQPGVGTLLLALTSLTFINFGIKYVDKFNKICMLGLIFSYVYLLNLTSSFTNSENLLHYDWDGFLFVVPFAIISFGFHNVIPTVSNYLKYDVKQIKKAIIIGGLIPLTVYIFWIYLALSVIPLNGEYGIINSISNDKLATEILGVITNSKTLLITSSCLAFFATITSILSTGISMRDFLIDGFKIKEKKYSKIICSLLTFAPPYIITLINPNIFFTAIDYAGGLATILLFAILPGCMVWQGRKQFKSEYSFNKSKTFLVIIILIGVFVFSVQIGKTFKLIDVRPKILKSTA